MARMTVVDRLTLGPQRRRRRMLLRQLDDLDAGRAPRRKGVLLRGGVCLLTCGLMSAFALALLSKQFGVSLTPEGFRRAHPLGTPPTVESGVGAFRFVAHQHDDAERPVAYDPCRPVEYEVNDAVAPAGGDRIIEDAVAEVERATGLVFDRLDDTDRLPGSGPSLGEAGRTPVLVAWTTPEVEPELAGRVAGIGGSTAHEDSYTGERLYVTGMVALDAPQLEELLRTEGEPLVRAVVMHELGHLVGLAHVEDPQELMYDENVGQLEFGPGDREGLAALGSGRCFF